MKYLKLLQTGIVLTALLGGCAPVSQILSDKQTRPFNLNEVSSLVGDSLMTVHGEQNVLYSVSNDKDNMYVTLMIADRKTQDKILQNGFTLWIDTTGAKKEKQGIMYPLSSHDKKNQGETRSRRNKDADDNMDNQDKAAQLEAKRRVLFTMTDMDLIGFKEGPPMRVPTLSKSGGVSVSMMYDSNGTMQYHAIIPFASFHYHPWQQAGKKKKPISVACTTGRPEAAPVNHEAAGSHGGGFGGGGGMPGDGGGMGGGRHGGGGGGNYVPEDDPLDIWVHVLLYNY